MLVMMLFCPKCGAIGARGITKEEAIKKWNMRIADNSYVDILKWE